MPFCAVTVCKNSTRKVSYAKDGISFHRFPTDPNLKEKWIDATGRAKDWFPTKSSTICSTHFDPKCFKPSTKFGRLFQWAIPTLRLRLVYCLEPSPSKESDYLGLDIKKELRDEEADDPLFLPPSVPDYPPKDTLSDNHNYSKQQEINDKPRKQLRDFIIRQKYLITVQKKKIRTCQRRCNRYQKRIAELKAIVLELKKRDLPPVMINQSQQVNFMHNVPKSTSVQPET